NQFVIVLIDGDELMFHGHFIQAGEEGGRRAAAALQAAVAGFLQRNRLELPEGVKVCCRVFADFRQLATTLASRGLVDDMQTVEQFARGFTRGLPLFDFIDVGAGGAVPDKVIGNLKLNLTAVNCRHILLGCPGNDNYIATLANCNGPGAERITILEGAPLWKDLRALGFESRRYMNIFQDSNEPHHISDAEVLLDNGPGVPAASPPSPGFLDSPHLSHVVPKTRNPSISTTTSSDLGKFSWAKIAVAAPPPAPEPEYLAPAVKPVEEIPPIRRNRLGQRVDPPCQKFDKANSDRVRSKKLCITHFLRHDCPHDPCDYVHDYSPNAKERSMIELVARMAMCRNGSKCDDPKCIYGHLCPAPRPHKNRSSKGKPCPHGKLCVFPPELHDVDCVVVKTKVIRN
ncbi:hypothetical protein M011DRAFT_407438, partial [Sporormia fimetaria CBS 119925]